MEFLILIILVIAMILLIKMTNKFDKVNIQLEQSNRMVDGLYQMIKKLQSDIDRLQEKGRIQTYSSSNQEVEKERIVVPPPIPSAPPVEAAIPSAIKETIIPKPIQIVSDSKDQVRPVVDRQVSKIEQETSPVVNNTPKKPQESKLANALKEVNWLNAIGIITLVLGIGFFVKYAIDQDWINEIGRVALGIAVGGIIVGIAHKLSVKYRVFSSILLGGGFATFYTTITLAFREYEIFNQTTAFVILTIITVLAILLSIAYKRQEVAIFAFIGGMLSPLLVSTGDGNHIVLFSYILLLNTGVLIVAVRQKWLLIDKFSYVLTFLYLSTWLLAKYEITYQLEAILFTGLFFLQFMLLLILRYRNKPAEQSPWGQLLYITVTNFTVLVCFFIIHAKSPGVNYLGVIVIAMALINALFIISSTKSKTKSIDNNFIYTLLAITIGLVSLAIPVQLSKVYITLVWAVEMSVLFWIWTRTKANLFRVGAMFLSILTVISYLMDIRSFSPMYEYQEDSETTVLVNLLPIIFNQYTLTGIVVLGAFFFVYQISKKNQIQEDNTIGVKSIPQPTREEIQKGLGIVLYVLAYVVLFLELSYQISCRIEYPTTGTIHGTYKMFCLVVYTLVFGSVYFVLNKQKMTEMKYLIYVVLSSVLLLVFIYAVTEVRSEIFNYEQYPKSYFTLHLLAFAIFVYFYFMLYRSIGLIKEQSTQWLNAILFASLVLLFSVELDNITLWMLSTPDKYYTLLGDVHAYGYPILWGIMAMLLMIFGMNKQQAKLRKLSLLSFGIIVLKFYLYDVWRMNQGGKIASFVLLGIILLVVSFLLERIKLLLKDKEEQSNDTVK